LVLLPFLSFLTDFIFQAKENLGMAMMYTLATSAKEWLTEKFCGDSVEESEETEAKEDEVCIYSPLKICSHFLQIDLYFLFCIKYLWYNSGNSASW
jgi:uncharacterized membrane protein